MEYQSFSDADGVGNDLANDSIASPAPCSPEDSTVVKAASENGNASSRINVTDNSALGLPRAVIRMACSKGTYVRAFARDLGEALGTGAHLDALQRSRSGIFRVEASLSIEDAIHAFAPITPKS